MKQVSNKNILPFPSLYTHREKSGIRGEVRAFTLVELIVVIVILSILATISFLSFSSYSSSSRDSVRLGDITNIAKGLTLQYSIGGSYIIPDNSVSLLSGSTTIIGYQGKAGYNTLNSIKLSTSNNNSGKDPLDNTYYTYNINSNKNKYQLSGFLENKGNIINRTSSINNTVENEKGKIENNNEIVNNYLIPHLTSPKTGEGQEDSVIASLSKNPFLSLLGDDNNRNYNQTISNPLDNQKEISHLHSKGQVNNVTQRNEAIYNNIDLNNFSLINQINATTYTNRYPYTKGDSIGVILNYTGTTTSNNTIYTPIEDNISTSTGTDISSGTITSGKIVINNNTDSSTGVSVVSMSGYVSSGGSSSNIPYEAGTCGSSNGLTLSSIPTNNLCSLGTTGAVLYNTGMGQYNWTCGSSTNCKANDNFNVLLLHFDGINNSTSFLDSGIGTKTVTQYGNSIISNIQSTFGGTSGVFDGAGDYLLVPNSSDWNFGAGNFTIDFWIYPTAPTSDGLIVGTRDAGANTNCGIFISINSGNNKLRAAVHVPSGTAYGSYDITTLNMNTWYHVALVRNGATVTVYLNGVTQPGGSLTGNIGANTVNFPTGSLGIMTDPYYYTSRFVSGYLDELRISKGIARWTSDFTPPTVPY